MAFRVITTWHNDNPDTVWNKLRAKLGRDPTREEAIAEVRRILADVERRTAPRIRPLG